MNADSTTALQNETISHLAWRIYGNSRGRVEAILALNPGLCLLPAQLPMGTVVRLPPPQAEPVGLLPGVNLWD